MDKHRQIAFISAFIVALIIMMVGKACTDKMFQKQEKPATNVTQSTPSYDNSYSYSYGNNNGNVPQQVQTTVQQQEVQQTEPPVQYVTNMFGEVVGTETVATEPVTETETVTQERSILEQYNESHGNASPDVNSNGNSYQPPSEISITIH